MRRVGLGHLRARDLRGPGGLGQDRVQLAVRSQADHELAGHDREAADVLLVAHHVTGDGGRRPSLVSVVPGWLLPNAAPYRARWAAAASATLVDDETPGSSSLTPAGTPTKS